MQEHIGSRDSNAAGEPCGGTVEGTREGLIISPTFVNMVEHISAERRCTVCDKCQTPHPHPNRLNIRAETLC